MGPVVKMMTVTIAAYALLWVMGCAQSSQPSESTGVQRQAEEKRPTVDAEVARQRGGKLTLTHSTNTFGNPNDPHLVIAATGRVYSMPVTNWLLQRDVYDKDFSIIRDLVKTWEVSKDGLTYTFKLQEGVKFHNVSPVNGREFTSEDAKYSLLRITAHPSVVVEKWVPRFQRRADFGAIDSIDTPDKHTLVVKLRQPHAPFLDAVAHPGTQMLPKEFVEKFPDKIITEGMIGTGPYLPLDYKNRVIASYKKNPDYWKKDPQGGQLPYLDELAILFFADVQAELAAFRTGQLDVTRSGSDLSIGGVEKTIKGAVPNVKVFVTPTFNVANFRFNVKFQPFQDVRVRRAIHLALDRHQFLELTAEGKGVITGPLSPIYPDLANSTDWLMSQPGYRKDKTQDMEEARRLLKEAGYGDGFVMSVMGNTGGTSDDVMALLHVQLKPLNITVKAELVDYAGQWLPRSAQGDFELGYLTFAMGSDADSIMGAHIHTDGGRNYGKFSDPVLDEMVDKQRTATSLEERKRWAQEAEKRILNQAPMAFLYAPSNTMFAQPWVHNVADGPLSGSAAYSVEQAWLEKR